MKWFQRKYVYVDTNHPYWREWQGVLVKKGRLYGHPLEINKCEDQFVVLWDDMTVSTESKTEYTLVFGD